MFNDWSYVNGERGRAQLIVTELNSDLGSVLCEKFGRFAGMKRLGTAKHRKDRKNKIKSAF